MVLRGRHLAALLGTFLAGLGALAAMLHLVPAALLRAGLADLRTELAEGLSAFAGTRHGSCGHLGAVDVQRMQRAIILTSCSAGRRRHSGCTRQHTRGRLGCTKPWIGEAFLSSLEK